MAQRAMRGYSRILQEPGTGKLEAATAAARRRNIEKRDGEWRGGRGGERTEERRRQRLKRRRRTLKLEGRGG